MIGIFFAYSFLGIEDPLRAETVTIDNQRGEKVKFCTYRSDDESLIRPRQCWMLGKGQSIKWNRGTQEHAYDIRLFEPGAFELPICLKQNISKSYRIEIAPRRTKSCVIGHARTFVPPQTWTINSRVLVNRLEDNFWYPATILRSVGSQYRVRFNDGRLATIDARLIADFTLDQSIPIQVNWKRQGRWYPVQLKTAKKDKVRVKFEDGSEEDASLDLIRVSLSES